ncbi:MAG: prolyl oligopeptidase family serine peptidase [Phycisphaerae bacterium]|nr:prolyl oligopeptidase family serine peptidase [Phycisphaerae bacterium]
MREVHISSSADGKIQPAMFYAPRGTLGPKAKPAPLLVALHQWSHGFDIPSVQGDYLSEVRKRGWVFIHPHFRGRNDNPLACASDLAVQDVLDAVAFARANASVDPKRIYLLGVSGGGHMTLMMVSKAPKLWAAASVWVPIFDLVKWHAETKLAGRIYWKMLEAVCGGPPGKSRTIDAQYRHRSPRTYLRKAAGLPMDINAGIHDGHTGSVPILHSLLAFNVLAAANGKKEKQIPQADIRHMAEKECVPLNIAYRGKETDRKHAILFRRQAGPARVTIFEGGHEFDPAAAFAWLATRRKQ